MRLATSASMEGKSSNARRRVYRLLLVIPLLAALPCVLHYATRISPPDLPPPTAEDVRSEGPALHVGPAYLARRGKLWVMQIKGKPEQLGYRHARLATPLMAEGDRRMIALFATYFPSAVFRWAVTSLVRVRYRQLDSGLSSTRRAEIFGEASGYPDDFADFFPTYQRLVYLHGLYDIALAFEHSPLLGCTAFAASNSATSQGATPGHTIVGRNFDFEVDPWFDEQKIVQIVEPDDRLAFVSVAWAGMTGVVTGMNAAGIWISVNGGRAGPTRSGGVPVVFTTRAVLEEARSLDEALQIIERDEPMVSHILFVADGKSGESMVVERAPDQPLGVIRHPSSMVVANHFRTAPLRDDPKNEHIRDTTSTEARQARMEDLVRRHYGHIDPKIAVEILRDRSGVGDAPLPLGNRNALDALVATHSVVADLTERAIWVSEGPNTLGHYRRIDLDARLRQGEAAALGESAADLPPDALLGEEAYERYRQGLRERIAAAHRADEGELRAAADLYHRAIALRPDDHLAWRGLASVEERLGHSAEARNAWLRVLALAPESPEAMREAKTHLGQ